MPRNPQKSATSESSRTGASGTVRQNMARTCTEMRAESVQSRALRSRPVSKITQEEARRPGSFISADVSGSCPDGAMTSRDIGRALSEDELTALRSIWWRLVARFNRLRRALPAHARQIMYQARFAIVSTRELVLTLGALPAEHGVILIEGGMNDDLPPGLEAA